eukprot:259103-Chlamydomonas_euryale.AAC.1
MRHRPAQTVPLRAAAMLALRCRHCKASTSGVVDARGPRSLARDEMEGKGGGYANGQALRSL